MDIQELIEQIVAKSKNYGMFYFKVIDTSSPNYPTAVDCQEVVQRDYWELFTERKFIHKTEDAIAFLFDADIHLWQLVKYDLNHYNCGGLVTTWDITLRR